MENKANSQVKIAGNDMRIVIIGAGAAGLTAASSLRDKGYQNIVILERSDRVGGKCSTVQIEGKLYELGAGMISVDNKTAMSLAKKYNIRLKRIQFGKSLTLNTKNSGPRKKRSPKKILQLFKQLIIYRGVQKKFAGLAKPGFANINHQELSLPFSKFAQKYKFETLAKELELTYTGFGYGYFTHISAAYVLKYYSWATVMSFVKRSMYFFSDGIEHLWTAVAKDFEIKYGVDIQTIRRGNGVSIDFAQNGISPPQTIGCDRLIVTSPLDEMLSYIDATPAENKLFSDIQHIDYCTLACRVSNFPKVTGFAPKNFFAFRAGHPVFWYCRHPDTDIYTFYVLGRGQSQDNELTSGVQKFIQPLGGTLNSVHTIRHWKYFPHVSPDKIKRGFYDSLETLQGQNNTYYAGELLNFSTVGLTSEYAESLIQKFF